MSKFILVIIILVTLLIGIVAGIFLASYVIAQIQKDEFCMKNWFAEKVMSCYIGNQSQCLDIRIEENNTWWQPNWIRKNISEANK